jgi:hypothetical protein
VAAVEQVFNADFAKTSITPPDGDDLVWSPTDSQTHLLALINGAQHTLDVQEEEFGDPALVNAGLSYSATPGVSTPPIPDRRPEDPPPRGGVDTPGGVLYP